MQHQQQQPGGALKKVQLETKKISFCEERGPRACGPEITISILSLPTLLALDAAQRKETCETECLRSSIESDRETERCAYVLFLGVGF